jgi:hypothetical protein
MPSHMACVTALRFAGRFSHRVAIPSSRVTAMGSSVTGGAAAAVMSGGLAVRSSPAR